MQVNKKNTREIGGTKKEKSKPLRKRKACPANYFIKEHSAHSPSVQHLCTKHTWTRIVAPPRVRHSSGETWGNGDISKLQYKYNHNISPAAQYIKRKTVTAIVWALKNFMIRQSWPFGFRMRLTQRFSHWIYWSQLSLFLCVPSVCSVDCISNLNSRPPSERKDVHTYHNTYHNRKSLALNRVYGVGTSLVL